MSYLLETGVTHTDLNLKLKIIDFETVWNHVGKIVFWERKTSKLENLNEIKMLQPVYIP